MLSNDTTSNAKRNSGRTGPTSPAGRARSAQNSRKHGATATTLILPAESEEGWLIVLSRWEERYQPEEDSLEAQFVQNVAEAEWFRLRTQRYYDDFIRTTQGLPPFLYNPEQIKMHNLMLRYKRDAERAFQKEFRAIEALYKSNKANEAEAAKAEATETAATPPDSAKWPEFKVVRATHEQVHESIKAQRPPLPDDDNEDSDEADVPSSPSTPQDENAANTPI